MGRQGLWLAVMLAVAPAAARAGGAALELRGRGVQIYQCAAAPGGFGWRLAGPEADLFDAAGRKLGRHFAGPSWQANDGSLVTGEVMASNAAPDAGAVPWLLLRAKTRAGAGVFATVEFIARLHTQGGVAPAVGCDAAHAGARQRVAYEATYIFWGG